MKHDLDEHVHFQLAELIVIISGKMQAIIRDKNNKQKRVDLNLYDSILFPPKIRHKLKVISDAPTSFLTIKFKPDKEFIDDAFYLLNKKDWRIYDL